MAELSTQVSGPSTVIAGSHPTYTVTVGNAGPAVATGVVLTDIYPFGAGVESVSGSGVTCTDQGLRTLSCTLPDIPANSSVSADFQFFALRGRDAHTPVHGARERERLEPNDNSATIVTTVTAGPVTFVVTNTNDSGAGSLRQAITRFEPEHRLDQRDRLRDSRRRREDDRRAERAAVDHGAGRARRLDAGRRRIHGTAARRIERRRHDRRTASRSVPEAPAAPFAASSSTVYQQRVVRQLVEQHHSATTSGSTSRERRRPAISAASVSTCPEPQQRHRRHRLALEKATSCQGIPATASR